MVFWFLAWLFGSWFVEQLVCGPANRTPISSPESERVLMFLIIEHLLTLSKKKYELLLSLMIKAFC